MEINIKELSFLTGSIHEEASWAFKYACDKERIEYKPKMRLPADVIERHNGFYNLKEAITQIGNKWTKLREYKSELLNDMKCVKKGDFTGRFTPLKRLLSEEDKAEILANWKAKQELLKRQTSLV